MKSKYVYPFVGCIEDAGFISAWNTATVYTGGLEAGFSSGGLPGTNVSPFFMSDVLGQPALAGGKWLNGTAPIAGGPQTGYYRTGPGARIKFNGPATEIEIEVFCTSAFSWQQPTIGILSETGQVLLNTSVPFWIWDGTKLYQWWTPPCDSAGYNTWKMVLPPGTAKNVEVLQPYQQTNYVELLGYPPYGAYVTRVGFNAPMYVVPPPTVTNKLLCEVDTIGLGGAMLQGGFGVGYLLKRGLSVQPTPALSFAGGTYANSPVAGAAAYSSGTAYAKGAVANQGVWVYQSTANSNVGNTPSATSAWWSVLGYIGEVYLTGYGGATVYDDWGSSGAATAAATARAGIGATAMWWQRGMFDWLLYPLSPFSTNFPRALAALYAAQPSLPIFVMGMPQLGNPETASPYPSGGGTPAGFRSEMAAAAAAASGTVNYASALSVVPLNEYLMTFQNPYPSGIPLYPATVAGQQALLNFIQRYITT
jgi:hypothetical protein